MSQWRVLIEENIGGTDRKEWRVSDIYEVMGEREEARAIAQKLAMTHTPKHPMLPQERAVYRINDDMWLTMVIGAKARYHYRVTVAELIYRG
ncbi:hypothetical protein Pth03_18240 [Planotetraspora thailandica]|uniref:Uncharacterized protein n=1 Tax=Planotetraspora thailandica TaxID=487172 RepID=A0A8J3XUU5_9ACTN|nr:hypothetical protein [Planotetraspora thailandica]GII53435.1 hypothetical protein Pth03_18240 [Planotetraspora thailandica]